MDNEKLLMLMKDCGERPELFNRISNILYENFGNLGSAPALLVTWVVMKYFDTEEG